MLFFNPKKYELHKSKNKDAYNFVRKAPFSMTIFVFLIGMVLQPIGFTIITAIAIFIFLFSKTKRKRQRVKL